MEKFVCHSREGGNPGLRLRWFYCLSRFHLFFLFVGGLGGFWFLDIIAIFDTECSEGDDTFSNLDSPEKGNTIFITFANFYDTFMSNASTIYRIFDGHYIDSVGFLAEIFEC